MCRPVCWSMDRTEACSPIGSLGYPKNLTEPDGAGSMCPSALKRRAIDGKAAVLAHSRRKGGSLMRWKGLLAFTAMTLGLGLTWSAPAAADAPPAYLDPHQSVETRVNDLLGRMTLPEKIGQMDQIVVSKLRDTAPPANGDCTNKGGNT